MANYTRQRQSTLPSQFSLLWTSLTLWVTMATEAAHKSPSLTWKEAHVRHFGLVSSCPVCCFFNLSWSIHWVSCRSVEKWPKNPGWNICRDLFLSVETFCTCGEYVLQRMFLNAFSYGLSIFFICVCVFFFLHALFFISQSVLLWACLCRLNLDLFSAFTVTVNFLSFLSFYGQVFFFVLVYCNPQFPQTHSSSLDQCTVRTSPREDFTCSIA